MTLAPGQVLNNRYWIVKWIGGGGFGNVYRAWDINLERPRALKESFEASPEAQRQFKREAQMLSDLTHPNLPKVIDHFIIAGQGQYLVMEYVEGQDLQQMLDAVSPGVAGVRGLLEAQAIPWMGQICAALGYLHEQQPPVIHRDIKPGNIKITPQGKAVLVDFGIAKLAGPSGGTLTGAKAATPGYAPPEQLHGQPTDARSDIYALGATLYHLLTGQIPVDARQRWPHDPLIRPEVINPAISARVAGAIWQALQMEPAARFPGVDQFKTALILPPAPQPASPAAVIYTAPTVQTPAQQSPAAPPVAAGTSPRPPWLFWLIGLVFVGVIVAAFILGRGTSKNDENQRTATALAGLAKEQTPPATAMRTPRPEATMTNAPTETSPSATFTTVPDTPMPTLSLESTFGIGSTMVSEKDGMAMVYVPEAKFWMGSKAEDTNAADDQKKQHEVYLDAFWIDRTEVTNAMFAQFVQETSYRTDAEKAGWGYAYVPSANEWQQVQGAQWRNPGGATTNITGKNNYPVVQVSWNDANAYCRWAGRRLPTEAEWEKAARGGLEGKQYPWGDEAPVCQKGAGNGAKFDDNAGCDDTGTEAVGSYAANGYGLYDMAGNVWEWVSSLYKDYPYDPNDGREDLEAGGSRVLRGGSWNYNPNYLRTAGRSYFDPSSTCSYGGFRCARSP